MHGYASNNHSRSPTTYLLIGFMAFVLSTCLSSLQIELVMGKLQLFAPLSAMGIYGLLVFLYDRWLWQWASTLRNLNGTWIGEIISSYDQSARTCCVAHIHQSWTRIEISLETKYSRSRTTMAALLGDGLSDAKLQYEYLSEPKGLATGTMQTHRGVCLLKLEHGKDGRRLTGDYYTGRGRQTHGQIVLKFSGRKIQSYDDLAARR